MRRIFREHKFDFNGNLISEERYLLAEENYTELSKRSTNHVKKYLSLVKPKGIIGKIGFLCNDSFAAKSLAAERVLSERSRGLDERFS